MNWLFQTPQAGQCLCNMDGWRIVLSKMHFQTPQSGQCLCNFDFYTSMQYGVTIFQTPQSGQCLCNAGRDTVCRCTLSSFRPLNRGNASATPGRFCRWCIQSRLSDPSIGAMPLQPVMVARLRVIASTFRPLNRGNASATWNL